MRGWPSLWGIGSRAGVHGSAFATAARPVQASVGTVVPVPLERGELESNGAGERRGAGIDQVVMAAPGQQAGDSISQRGLCQSERVHGRVAEHELDEQGLLTVFENHAARVLVLLCVCQCDHCPSKWPCRFTNFAFMDQLSYLEMACLSMPWD